jgi:phthalate 4,5-dioxygenase reductase subunit
MNLLVSHKAQIAGDIYLFEVRDANGAALPGFTPGAHVEVTGPTGLVRKYSLCSAPGETGYYRFAVKKEHHGQGGSRAMIEGVHTGDRLDVSTPRNDFPLEASAERFLFIAGGIGITPIYAMMQHLDARGVPYDLYYFARTASVTAFLNEVNAPREHSNITVYHDEGDPSRAFDVAGLLAAREPGTHIYCCGPRPLMDAVREAAANWPRGTVHFEDFGSAKVAEESNVNRPFRCHLAKSGVTLDIPADKSIVQVMREHGFDVPTSCETGSCATCKTALIAGVADHRDLALFDDEQDTFIIPCVSRAKTQEITIDR